MVLSADDMGIRKGLEPIFCCCCGHRIGWHNPDYSDADAEMYCEDCAKKEAEE